MRLEPVVVRGGAVDFGTSVSGGQSIEDVQDLITSGAYRVNQLAQAYTDYAPTWVQKDQTAFVGWTSDWTAFQNRWNAAVKNAQDYIASAKYSLVPNSLADASGQYTTLAKALRAAYPPDGGPIAKGDYDDLLARFATAKGTTIGQAVNLSQMPQPSAGDPLMAFYKKTASADLIAQATGEEKPKAPGMSGVIWLVQWLHDHPKTVLAAGLVVGGGVVLAYVAPVLGLAFKGFKGVAALATVGA